jgi:hypothetical protein
MVSATDTLASVDRTDIASVDETNIRSVDGTGITSVDGTDAVCCGWQHSTCVSFKTCRSFPQFRSISTILDRTSHQFYNKCANVDLSICAV